MSTTDGSGSVRRALRVVAEHRSILVFSVAAAAITALTLSLLHDRVYLSTAELTVPTETPETEIEVISGPSMRYEVALATGRTDVPTVDAELGSDDRTLLLHVRDSSAGDAADFANAYAQAYLRAGLMLGTQVSASATRAVGPEEPTPIRTTSLAALAGLAIGLVAITVKHRLGRTITTLDELAAVAPGRPLAVDTAELAVLVATTRRIQFASAVPGPGAAMTAVELARSLVAERRQVALVDADVTSPLLHRLYRVDGSRGLIDNLDGDELEMTLLPINDDTWLLPTGQPTGNVNALLHRKRMRDVIDELARQFARLLIVSAPVSEGGVATSVGQLVDGVVLVVEPGTSIDDVETAIATLGHGSAPIVGIVLRASANG
jgi:Mrp family chromosome partitioning ATPase